MTHPAPVFTIWRSMSHPIVFALLLLSSVAACSRRDVQSPTSGTRPAPNAPAPDHTDAQSVSLPLRDGDRPLLHPIHAGVQVSIDPNAARVAYTRSRGKAFGTAYMLTPGMLARGGAIELTIRTSPELRPQVCLTDAAGYVWNAPATVGSTPEHLRFDLQRLQADPFQNNGKKLPASADIGTMRVLTILDISGFMGGAPVPCEWTIEKIALTAPEEAAPPAQDKGSGL